MGISYESLHIYGADFKYGDNMLDFEREVYNVFNVCLGDKLYLELDEKGVKREDYKMEDYGGMYNEVPFSPYRVLSFIQSGNYWNGDYYYSVGFSVDLNKESFESIEKKRQIFEEELEDFKKKIPITHGLLGYETIEYVL